MLCEIFAFSLAVVVLRIGSNVIDLGERIEKEQQKIKIFF